MGTFIIVWRLKAKRSIHFERGVQFRLRLVCLHIEREDWFLLDRVIDAPVHTGYTNLGDIETW